MVFFSQENTRHESINPETKEVGFFIRENHSGFWIFSKDVAKWPIRDNFLLLEKIRGTYVEISNSEYESHKNYSAREKDMYIRYSKKNIILLEPAFFSFSPGENEQSYFDKILIHKVHREGSHFVIKGFGELLYPGKRHEKYISEEQGLKAKMELLFGKSVVLNPVSLSFTIIADDILIYRGRKFFRLIK